ncbi:hypothetical protein C3L33_16827, partial [Rhododendron williamsianum]
MGGGGFGRDRQKDDDLLLKQGLFSFLSPSSLNQTTSSSSSCSASAQKVGGVSEDALDSVDEFLREALQNPRERLSGVKLKEEANSEDGTRHSKVHSGSYSTANGVPTAANFLFTKTSDCRLPSVRLADIPLNLPTEDSGVTKVAIKQRPQKGSLIVTRGNSPSTKSNHLKSVEERKEEYNRARARIFSSSISSGSTGGRPESELRARENYQHNSSGMSRAEEKLFQEDLMLMPAEVAIFRDRDVERKDPDFDRSYDRYMQRFDPGFGFNGGPYVVQPMQWAAPSAPGGIGYGHPDAMMTQFNHNHVGAHPTSALYWHSAQHPSQHPVVTFIHPHEQVHQHFSQSHQQQLDASFGLARPRRGWLEWRVQSYVVPSLIYSTNSVTVGASLVYDEAHCMGWKEAFVPMPWRNETSMRHLLRLRDLIVQGASTKVSYGELSSLGDSGHSKTRTESRMSWSCM